MAELLPSLYFFLASFLLSNADKEPSYTNYRNGIYSDVDPGIVDANINITYRTRAFPHFVGWTAGYGTYVQPDHARPAMFGVVVAPSNGDGCSSLGAGRTFRERENWLALLTRGNCKFQRKMENAYLANASGVILYDGGDDLPFYQMSPHPLPGVIVSRVFGQEILLILESSIDVKASVRQRTQNSPATTSTSRTSMLFVMVSFVVLIVISLTWLVFYYVQRLRHAFLEATQSKRRLTAVKRALSKLPKRTYDGNGSSDGCAVCLDPYQVGDSIRVLTCRHEFHEKCVDPWLLQHHTCPMCKKDIMDFDREDRTGLAASMAGSSSGAVHVARFHGEIRFGSPVVGTVQGGPTVELERVPLMGPPCTNPADMQNQVRTVEDLC